MLIYFVMFLSGTVPGDNGYTVSNRLMDLRAEMMDLEQKESMLDQQKFWVEQSTKNTREDCSEYPFYKNVATSAAMKVFV